MGLLHPFGLSGVKDEVVQKPRPFGVTLVVGQRKSV